MGALRRVLYAASFDPPTSAEVEIATRAAALFDEVIVGVEEEPSGRPLLPHAERVTLLTTVLAPLPGVRVVALDAPPATAAEQSGCQALLLRLRDGSDLEPIFETLAALRRAGSSLDLVILMSSPAQSFVSSTLVREVARLGGDISGLVTPEVLQAIRARGAPLDRKQEPP